MRLLQIGIVILITSVSATFTTLVYVHNTFATTREFVEHRTSPHKNAVAKDVYRDDKRVLENRLKSIDGTQKTMGADIKTILSRLGVSRRRRSYEQTRPTVAE